MPEKSYDVVVVGSGPGGCTAAILLARAGLRVALLEAHTDPASYKRLCTHLIMSSALPTLQRLGVDAAIEKAGGVPNHLRLWTEYGWLVDVESARRPPHGYNLRRVVLDPLLRSTAAGEPGVELLLGAKVHALTRSDKGRVTGVIARLGGEECSVGAHLVVGADGRHSKVAELAGLPGKELPNERFLYFASYKNVGVKDGVTHQMWTVDTDTAYAMANEDGITVLAAMLHKSGWQEFDKDHEAGLLGAFRSLVDAPDLSRAERVSDIVGTKDYPSVNRKRIVAPGVALVGDAAMVADPMQGIGYGWALQTAEWLADAVAPALAANDVKAVDRATRRYARTHRRRLGLHQLMNVDSSSGRPLNAFERLLFAGGARDPWVADRIWQFATRNASPLTLFDPRLIGRAALARRRTP